MRNIKRPSQFDALVKQLCEYQSTELGRSAFRTFRDLYVFAALLGFELQKQGRVGSATTELDSRPFVSDDAAMEAMLALALAATKDRTVLLLESEDRVVDIFEGYLSAGLEQIAVWCEANPTDDSGVRAILEGMVDKKLIQEGLEAEGREATF